MAQHGRCAWQVTGFVAMEWLLAVWNKINKPLHYLVVGCVWVVVAPQELSWGGYIFIAFGAVGILEWIVKKAGQYIKRRNHWKTIENYIPHMTDKEREIIAYLLNKNQKTFTCAADGGYANTLMSRGIVVVAMRWGHIFDEERMPVTIPDKVWNILVKHKNCFPYKPTDEKAHPWRISWMVR